MIGLRAAVACAAIALAGCGSKAYVKKGFMDQPPKRVAVLPFTITYAYDRPADQLVPEAHAVGREVFRAAFHQALAPYGYEDIPLQTVDQQLAAAYGPLEQGRWQQLTPQVLGKTLDVDALIYGDISRVMHLASPLYTETSLMVSLRMVEAASGEVLWRRKVQAAERGGALKKGQVVDFVKDQARSYADPSVKFRRVAGDAVVSALRGFPNPPMTLEGRSARQAAGAGGARRLAILPVESRNKKWQAAADTMRMHLAAGLQESPFAILELQHVNAALKERGWQPGQPLPEPSVLAEVAKQLGADAWLRGTVTGWGRMYAGVASWVTAAMELELVDAAKQQVIWSDRERDTRHAGILKGPTGWKSLATAPITGLKRSHLDRVAVHVARDLAEELKAAPAVQSYANHGTQAASAKIQEGTL